ncbi:MAG: thioredoxin family protein [Candidatus Pacebacteria bacterium]|nr:thioredoxin family protein [Candidatus Paceibacterota bacterium]
MDKTIEVIGSGCPTCKKFYEIAAKAAQEMDLDIKVEYVADVRRIAQMGLMRSPALAINGKPVLVGFTPDMEKIKKAIRDNLQL